MRAFLCLVGLAVVLAGCSLSSEMSMKSYKGQCMSQRSSRISENSGTIEPCDMYGTKLICQAFTSSVERAADMDECLAGCEESEEAMREAYPLGDCTMTIKRAKHLCHLYCTRNYK